MPDIIIQQKVEQLEQRLVVVENALAGRIKTSAEWIADQITQQETEKTAHQIMIRINEKQVKLNVALPGIDERIRSLKETLDRIDISLDELYAARDEMSKPKEG